MTILEYSPLSSSGPSGSGRTDYGALTNAAILAISTPDELGTAYSTDDKVNYTFNGGSWYSPAGGALV